MAEEIIAAVLGLDATSQLALKVGSRVLTELLRHPVTEPDRPIAVVSSTPGRLRLRVSPAKRNPSVCSRIESRLATVPGVQCAQASPLTGTVLACYDPAALDAETLRTVVELSGAALRVVPADPEYSLEPLEVAAE